MTPSLSRETMIAYTDRLDAVVPGLLDSDSWARKTQCCRRSVELRLKDRLVVKIDEWTGLAH